MSIWILLKNLTKKSYLLENNSLVRQEKKKMMMMVKYQTVTWVLKIIWRVKKFLDKFDIKDMGYYHDHSLKKYALLLAEVFEKFIDTCFKSSPGLSWDAMLKMTGMKLEKISDIDMYLFIEKGLTGGVSYIAKRYAKAYNKYTEDYDPKKPSAFITYLDLNNLYGWTMHDYLPYGGLEWLKNVEEFDVMSVKEKS